ncbi:19230_t:CDS:2, partial [Gigaspora rosea]
MWQNSSTHEDSSNSGRYVGTLMSKNNEEHGANGLIDERGSIGYERWWEGGNN